MTHKYKNHPFPAYKTSRTFKPTLSTIVNNENTGLKNLPRGLLIKMYTNGHLTSEDMCRLAIALRNKDLRREFCKRKRGSSPPKNKPKSPVQRRPYKKYSLKKSK